MGRADSHSYWLEEWQWDFPKKQQRNSGASMALIRQRKGAVMVILLASLLSLSSLSAQNSKGNSPERLEWFGDLGFGLFIHWSFDSQLGSVISHSMVGASDDYLSRFIDLLPRTFNPTRFDAREWARLAKVAGIRYVVFTSKHHSGFCMFETETTDFNILNTPYNADITGQLITAFREQGIAIGLYFSPDDFHFLYRQGTLISRRRPEVQPLNNSALMEHNMAQVRELLSQYGPIDVLFFDGPAEGLTELAWELNPDVVITRGVLTTPEIAPSTQQALPTDSRPQIWEANFTMGTSWQFKPTNETYLSGGRLIELLIETRANGGNMLLNIGPTPNGNIPPEQENRLRELGLWLFVNSEAIYDTRPWNIPKEGDIWFTRKREENTVYAILTDTIWTWGESRTITLKSVRISEQSQVTVLGQNDQVLEYQPDVIPQTRWQQDASGLHITATRTQRLYNDRTWPNPVVFKITHASFDSSRLESP